MAYPMIKWLSFVEFRSKLISEFQCKYLELPHSLAIAGSAPEPIKYFERIVDGTPRRYAVSIADEESIPPSIIRSICARLKVDPAAFGLHLG